MTGRPMHPIISASLRILVAAVLLLLLAGVATSTVRAMNFAVTVTLNDANSPGPQLSDLRNPGCEAFGTDPCSLRDAVIFANSKATTDTTTITLPAGTYTLTIPGVGENFAATGDLDILRNVVINGAGASSTIVQASATGSASGGIDRVFQVGTDTAIGTATINGVTVRYGGNTAGGNGTGILVYSALGGSSLTLNDCIISDNVASRDGGGIYVDSGATLVANRTTVRNNTSGHLGGGVANFGTLTVTNSTFSGNHADGAGGIGGGGIHNLSGTVTVTNSTLSGNTANGAAGSGGGIRNFSGTLTVTNSTLSYNAANGSSGVGGGIDNGGTVTVTNSTFFSNTSSGGGGIFNGGTLTAVNTLIAGNTGGTAPDVSSGAFAAGSKNNLLGDGSGAIGIADGTNGYIVGHPARIDTTLGDNGTTNGTQTLALLPGSPAINAGDLATCLNITGTAPVAGKDQRGIARPQPSSGQCDIGAYEYVFPATATTLAASPNPSAVGQSVIFTAIVTVSGGTPTGSVTFKDGATVLGFAALSSGVASFTTAGLAAGSHAITAAYSGDATSPPSTSAVLTQVVNGAAGSAPTTTTLVSSTNPSTVGQSITFTATVAGSGGTPTGSATFKDGAAVLGTGALAGGVTTFSATLAQGSHAITAIYSGDATFAPSTSAVLTQVVGSGGGGGTTGGLQFFPLSAPVRLLDTRPSQQAVVHPGVPLSPNQALTLPGQFSSGGITVPAGAQALVGNATVDNTVNAPAGFATLYPSGAALPLASNLNFVPGTVRPNAFTVGLGSDGKFNLLSNTGGNFIIDITGYYAPPAAGGLFFHPLTAPVRLLDTRAGQQAFKAPGAALSAGQTLVLPGQFTFSGVTVPPSAKALAGNATVDNTANAPAGFATLFPGGTSLPPTSNLNFAPGTVAPNAFTVGLGGDGSFNLYSNTGGNFILDVTGYYDTNGAGGLLFYSLTQPVRELDTRAGQSASVHPGLPLTAKGTLNLPGSFSFSGVTVPVEAKALVGNATVDNSINAPDGFATLFPGGTTLPLASNLNYSKGTVAPNAFIVGVGADGTYNLYSLSGGNFILDISGYFAAGTGTSRATP